MLPWVSSLLCCPADLRLASVHNCTNQFLKINICLHTHTHTHTSYWFCFSGEPEVSLTNTQSDSTKEAFLIVQESLQCHLLCAAGLISSPSVTAHSVFVSTLQCLCRIFANIIIVPCTMAHVWMLNIVTQSLVSEPAASAPLETR